MHKNSLWCKVIIVNMAQNPFSISSTSTRQWHNPSPIIKGLLQLKSNLVSSMLTEAIFKWTLGNGKLVDFWNDHWHSSGIMTQNFGALYSISKFKNCSVHQMREK